MEIEGRREESEISWCGDVATKVDFAENESAFSGNIPPSPCPENIPYLDCKAFLLYKVSCLYTRQETILKTIDKICIKNEYE